MAARFFKNGTSYGIRVDKNVKKVRVTLTFRWNDLSGVSGVAIRNVTLNGQGGNVNLSYTSPEGERSGSTDLSSYTDKQRDWDLNLTGDPNPLNNLSISNDTLKFADLSGSDNNAIITLKVSNLEYYPNPSPPPIDPGQDPSNPSPPVTPPPPQPCPGPTPWSPAVPSSCPTKPLTNEVNSGLLLTQEGDNVVVLNLKRFANKLVTLKLTHQTSASWTQTFRYSVGGCSDISPDPGGSPYSKSDYFNSAILGTNEFFFYNVDGGDHNYYFTHGHVLPPSKPTRTNYIQECTGDPPSCYCVAFTETYSGPWPPCKPEVAILNSGGNIVRWQYHDGNGSFSSQQVTLEVISIRNAVPLDGGICTSTLKGNVWTPDPNNSAVNGNCLSDYLNHSEKIRFRLPEVAASKTSLATPICYSDFRGVAGGAPPNSPGGVSSGQYSVLHVYDEDFKREVDLTLSSGISVVVENALDDYISPFDEADPSTNANLGTLSRRHYTVQINDGTVISDGASNINIVIPQNVTAGGLGVDEISLFKKEKVNSNTFKVWFYTSFKNQEIFDNSSYHEFDELSNQTGSNSILTFSDMSVVPQNPTDPGNSDSGYELLDANNKKHYLITFLDDTIIADSEASNINVFDGAGLTADGESVYIYVSKKERVDDKNMRVWFRAFYPDRESGKKYDNAFVRDWSVRRSRDVNHSGNIFIRNWYVTPQL